MTTKLLRGIFSALFIFCLSHISNAQWTGTDPVYVTDPDAQVAIGTSSPQPLHKLTIKTPDNKVGLAIVTKEDGSETGLYVLPDHSNSVVKLHASGGANKNLALFTGNLEVMRITNLGNVGIGTTSAGHKLEITDAGSSNTSALRINTTGTDLFNWSTSEINPNMTSGKNLIHMIGKAENTKNSGYIGFNYVGSGADANFLTFGLYGRDNLFNILGNGKVGIGTTSPSYKLDIWTTDNLYNTRFYQPSTSTSTYNSNLIQGANSPVTGYFGTGGATVSNVHFRDAFVVGTQNNYPLNLNTNDIARVTILGSGNVGIGTSNPQSKLAVNGEIYAKKVKVTQTGWPDFVFNKEYALKPLSEVEAFVIKYKHLPEVPSAEEITKNDLDLGEMNRILLMKVEELTLYMIELKKENELQKERLDKLEKK